MNSNIDIIQNFHRHRSFHRIIIQGVCRNKYSDVPIIFKCWNCFGRLPDKSAFNISSSSSKFRRSQCLSVYDIACRRILAYYWCCLFNGKCLCSRTAVVPLQGHRNRRRSRIQVIRIFNGVVCVSKQSPAVINSNFRRQSYTAVCYIFNRCNCRHNGGRIYNKIDCLTTTIGVYPANIDSRSSRIHVVLIGNRIVCSIGQRFSKQFNRSNNWCLCRTVIYNIL